MLLKAKLKKFFFFSLSSTSQPNHVACGHCTLSNAHCTLSTAHFTISTALCTLSASHCFLFTAQYTLHTVHCSQHNTNCILHTAGSTMNTAQCLLRTEHFTLNITHYRVHCPSLLRGFDLCSRYMSGCTGVHGWRMNLVTQPPLRLIHPTSFNLLLDSVFF